MPRLSDRQESFLRAFRTHSAGPPPGDWPSPAILRRWLRRPGFRAALQSIQTAIHFQTDFHISSAATSAARDLTKSENPPTPKQLESILRLSHLRQRFTSLTPPLPTTPDEKPQPPPSPPPPHPYIPPEKRLTDAEFEKLAWQRHYCPPLRKCSHFPEPVPQDTFYFRLLQNPSALLWWLRLYGKQTSDHRHSHIIVNCKHLIPEEMPESPLPRFSKDVSPSDPSPLLGAPRNE